MSAVAYGALWMFIISIPWENSITIPGLGAISRLIGMVALSLTLLAAVVSGRFRRWQPFHIAAILFVVWAGLSVIIFDYEAVPRKVYTFLQLFLMLWMVWELAKSRQRVHGLLLAYVLGAYVSAFGTIKMLQENPDARRFALEGFDPNDLAAALALALPMAWYLSMVYRKPLLRWLCRAYIPVGLVAIGLTGSRGGMLATMVALLIVPLTMTHMSPGRLAAALVVLVFSGSLAVAYVPQTVVKRLATTSSDVQEGKLGGRLRLWVAGVHAFTQKPLLGHGTGRFIYAAQPFLPASIPQVAHNSYLSVLVENGLIGFLLFSWILIAVWRSLVRLPTLDRRFGLILFATLLVAMLPLTWEAIKAVWFVLAVLVGLAKSRVLQPNPAGRWSPYPAQGSPASARAPQPAARPASHWNSPV